MTKACRSYGHSVVPLHQSLPTQRGTSEPQLITAATCRNDCKKRMKLHETAAKTWLYDTCVELHLICDICDAYSHPLLLFRQSNAAHFMPFPRAYCTQATMKTFHRVAFEFKIPLGSVLETEKDQNMFQICLLFISICFMVNSMA